MRAHREQVQLAVWAVRLCALGKGGCQCVEGDSECAPQLARCNCGFSAALDEFHVPSRATRRYLRRPFRATRATDGSVIALYPRPLSMTGGVASIPTHRAMCVFTPHSSFFPSHQSRPRHCPWSRRTFPEPIRT